jgi:hypothetical protein
VDRLTFLRRAIRGRDAGVIATGVLREFLGERYV